MSHSSIKRKSISDVVDGGAALKRFDRGPAVRAVRAYLESKGFKLTGPSHVFTREMGKAIETLERKTLGSKFADRVLDARTLAALPELKRAMLKDLARAGNPKMFARLPVEDKTALLGYFDEHQFVPSPHFEMFLLWTDDSSRQGAVFRHKKTGMLVPVEADAEGETKRFLFAPSARTNQYVDDLRRVMGGAPDAAEAFRRLPKGVREKVIGSFDGERVMHARPEFSFVAVSEPDAPTTSYEITHMKTGEFIAMVQVSADGPPRFILEANEGDAVLVASI